jgi:hypothetical protein
MRETELGKQERKRGIPWVILCAIWLSVGFVLVYTLLQLVMGVID